MATSDSNITIHQPLQTLFEQLKSSHPRERYEAVCALGRFPVHEEHFDTWDRVWALTEDPDKRVSWAAGIAGSMITARNRSAIDPYTILNQAGRDVPDFLPSWEEVSNQKSCLPPPSLEQGEGK